VPGCGVPDRSDIRRALVQIRPVRCGPTGSSRSVSSGGIARYSPRINVENRGPGMTDRGEIAKVLRQLNDMENRRPELSVEETIAGIDSVMSDDVEGWSNGAHTPNRAAERENERMLFGAMADYQRKFDRVIIEPPFASVAWTVTATVNDIPISGTGCSNFEVDDTGKIRRTWLYADMTPLFSALAQ
jgi:hypothetical protein